MPILKVKNDSGEWQDIATAYSHGHTLSDITDLPASLVDDIESLKDKVGAHSVAYQVSTAVEANNYTHPETHPANMITGLANVAISGDYNDLINLPEGGSGGAFEQVQADWDETDTTSPAYIKNKPVISGDGGASVQANWEQSDETAADFIKNKPFYEYEGREEVLPLTTYAGFYLDSSYGVYSYGVSISYSFMVGETYIVRWDGIEHTCIAQDASILMSGSVILGNASAFGLSGNNEPFIIASIEGVGSNFYSLTDRQDGGSHSVQISKNATLAHQIDKKFIPIPFFGKENNIILEGTFQDTKYDADGDGIGDTWYNQAIIADSSDSTLVVGETYTVVWNSIEYRCQCIEFMGMPAVGNTIAVGDGDNGMPFAIARDINGDFTDVPCWIAMPIELEDDGIYHCAISGSSIKKVDLQYIYQPDWNENNKNSGSFIVNKPFGEIAAGTVIIPTTQTEFTMEMESTYISFVSDMGLSNYVYNGSKYTIVVDGVSYEATGIVEDGTYGVMCMTDTFLFAVFDNYEGTGMSIVASSQNGKHTYSVIVAEDIIQKIDEKYIPKVDGLPVVTGEDDGKTLVVSDGVWSMAKGVPVATTEDNGKFLRVVDGNWAAVVVENAEEVRF